MMSSTRAIAAGLFLATLLALLQPAPARAADIDYDYDDYEEFEVVQKKKQPPQHSTTKPGTVLTKTQRGEAGASEISFVLEQSLGSEFTVCGRFSATATHAGNQAGTKSVAITQLRLQRDELDDAEQADFQRLINANGYYRVRVPSNIMGADSGRRVMASIPARCLASGGLHENIVLHLDDRANVVAMEYTLPSGECYPIEDSLAPSSWSFNTRAYVALPKDAPRLNPDYATNFGPTPGQEQSANAPPPDMQKKPQQSFLKKYWMYLLPLGFIFLSNMAGPPEGQGQGGQGQAARKSQ